MASALMALVAAVAVLRSVKGVGEGAG